MILTEKQKTALKIKLALDGSGSKTRLAKKLDLYESQITLMCKTGFYPDRCKEKIKEYLNQRS